MPSPFTRSASGSGVAVGVGTAVVATGTGLRVFSALVKGPGVPPAKEGVAGSLFTRHPVDNKRANIVRTVIRYWFGLENMILDYTRFLSSECMVNKSIIIYDFDNSINRP